MEYWDMGGLKEPGLFPLGCTEFEITNGVHRDTVQWTAFCISVVCVWYSAPSGIMGSLFAWCQAFREHDPLPATYLHTTHAIRLATWLYLLFFKPQLAFGVSLGLLDIVGRM
jgi:hypothetical protein